ncbi:ATP-binding protein [Neorhizobium petrolearium]|uniref:ATP-binding protein n=1 Tax=Neorhizobium petrolearium TaxID=515361 RepID=UPI003F80BF6F
MTSIRRRFVLIALLTVTLSLVAASAVLIHIFGDSYSRRVQDELSGHITRLAAVLQFNADGKLLMPPSPADNRFLTPYSGLYWQIGDPAGKSQLRSPSLFDEALPLPDDAQSPGTIHTYRLEGPEQRDVMVQERVVLVAAPEGKRPVRIAVAIDAAEIDAARWTFALAILPYVVALALFLIVMSLAQLAFGLKPFRQLSADLNLIQNRLADRLPGPYAKELQGLADQLNHLLEMQSAAIDKARGRASDLAHGLKTPLTILSNNAFTLRERGEAKIAAELDWLARTMLAHVNHELARARIAQSPEQRRDDAHASKITLDIIRTLKRTGAGETLAWDFDIPDTLTLPVDPHDFRELVGNLLENATKWARTSIWIKIAGSGNGWRLVVEDDGPGVPEDKLADLTRRGMRLDTLKPGSGLGLAIVSEIATVYGLKVKFGNRADGGFRADILFPPN